MARQLVVIMCLLIASAGEVHSQDNNEARASIQIEAELIQGLGGGATLSGTTGFGTTGADGATSGVAAVTTASDSADGQTDTVQDGQQGGADDVPAPPRERTADDVAAQLMTNAQTGSLSIADTALVAAISSGKRSNQQNVESLVTVTMIDEMGRITSSTMRNSTLTADILGPSLVQAVSNGVAVQQATSGASGLLGGDIMQRSSGMTYFYVQVCSCGL